MTTTYDPATVEAAARTLLDHRDHGRANPVPPPDQRLDDLDLAYAIQTAMYRILTTERGARTIGWKIGGTNAGARAFLAIEAPFYGRLYDVTTTESPSELPAGRDFFRVHEAEIGLEIGADLDPAGAPFEAADVAAVTRAVLPAVEVVGSCFAPWNEAGGPNLTADNAAHGRWIRGRPITDWSGIDLLALAITVEVNGEVATTGAGANVDGGPFGATAWLATALAASGLGLRAGDFVTTGLTTAPVPAAPGQHVRADFGPLGTVELRLAAS
jgi:2-keto-4-pentenoate hydratase